MGDLLVVLARIFIDRQKALFGVEGEVASVIVDEVIGAIAIADHEQLHEAEQRAGVAVAGIILVLDNLLHGPSWIDAEALELDLHHRHAIDQQDDVVTVVAVLRIDAELIDHLKIVLAPILEVDQRIVQRRAIIAREGIEIAKDLGGSENVGRDDLVEQPGKLAIRQLDAVEGFELLSKITL
jgi:hypothetical protein